jgi:hypothetical protein
MFIFMFFKRSEETDHRMGRSSIIFRFFMILVTALHASFVSIALPSAEQEVCVFMVP